MGQIIGGAAKPKRCNLNKLSQLGIPAAGEYILVSSDNSMNAAGQGNFDCYIEGNGQTAATALPLYYLDKLYNTTGDAIDGAMTQQAVTMELTELNKEVTDLDQDVNGTIVSFVPQWQRPGYYLSRGGVPSAASVWNISAPITLKKGQTVIVKTEGANACIIAETEDGTTYTSLVNAPSGVSGLQTYSYTATTPKTIALSVKWGLGNVVMQTSQSGLMYLKDDVAQLQEEVTKKSDEWFVGAYKRKILVTSGQSHSSNDDRIKVDIKEGSKFAVYTTVNGESYNGQIFVKYGESSTNVGIGRPNKSYTAEHNISSIGVYFSSVNSDTTVEFTVLVDLLLSIVKDINDAKPSIAANTSNITNLSVYSNKNRRAMLIRGSNINKITYDNGVVTIPEGLVIRYLENGSLKNYVVPQAITLAATGYYKNTVWFDTDDKSFYSNGYLNSITDTMIYVFSFESDAKTSDLPIDLDGTGSRITGIDTSINTMKPIVYRLGYELNTSTDSPIALNSGRNIIIGNIQLVKDCTYKVNITITYDTSRAGALYVGFFKGNTTVTSCAGTWSDTVIKTTDTSFSAYFVPSESADVGLLSVANYSYDSENKQYVSVTIEVDSIIKRLSTVENDISTINGEIDALDDRVDGLEASDPTTFEGRTLEQRRLAQHLGFGREATWTGDYMPVGWIPQLVFLHISDTHSNSACSNNAITALNLLSTRQKNKGNCAKFLIHTGDIKTENFNSDFTYWATARANANKPVFHVVGNHDVGFNKEVSTAGTDAQVYASNTEPFISGWDLITTNQGTPHPEGKNYYFKDFTDEKIRLIVLYEYETDFELDPSDSTKLKYFRPMRAFRQAQIDWLIDSLMKTPSDYGVIIAKHQMEDYVGTDDINFSSYFLRNNTGQDQTFTPRGMIADIVQAFIDATTLNQTYAITGGVVGDIVVNTDFSNKNIGSEFICYLSGHTHLDSIHYLKNYPKQLELTIGCDNTNYTHNSDMAQIANTKSADVINVCSIDRNRGYVYVVRVGSDFSYTAQKRDYVALDYRNHTS